jgi:HEAT repeat protein
MKKIIFTIIFVFTVATLLYSQDASKDAKAADVKKEVKKEEKKSKSTKEYIKDLASNDEATVVAAADWLGKEKEDDAASELRRLVKEDNRWKVRMYSAMALGYIGQESAIDVLNERLLAEPNELARYTVLLAITRIGVSKKEHVEVLKQAKERESDPFIKDYLDKIYDKFTKK